MVDERLALPGYPNLYVIGDMAHFPTASSKPLPGVAPVAMQQGMYAARRIRARLAGEDLPAFAYRDKGSLAVIGRNAGIAVFGRRWISGFLAWFAWVFIHIWYLIEFDNKLLVLIQWAWTYFTRQRGARLITERLPAPMVNEPAPGEAERLVLPEPALQE
jgi:NADH dehydrogenase